MGMNSPFLFNEYLQEKCENPPQNVVSDIAIGIAFANNDLANILDGKFKTALKPGKYNIQSINPLERAYSNDEGGLMSAIQTGFSITKHIGTFTSVAADAAYQDCRKLAVAYIAKFIKDSRDGVGPFDYSLNNLTDGEFDIERQDFAGDGYFSGVMVMFKYKLVFIECIDETVENSGWTN